MALQERPRPDANRDQYQVVMVDASREAFLEFVPEEAEEPIVKQPIFVIAPISVEAPSSAAEVRPQDRFLSRQRSVPGHIGFFRTFFRRVLLALHRGVTGALSSLHRGVTGTFLALYHGVTGALLALYRGVTGTLLALRRSVVGTLVALYCGVARALLALHHGVTGSILALHHGVTGILLALRRSVARTLLALHHGVTGALLALHRGVMGTLLALRRSVARTLLALYRGVTGIPLALCRGVVAALLALDRGMVRTTRALDRRMERALLALERGMEGLLLPLHRGMMGTLPVLQRCVVGTYVVARWTTSEVARWAWGSCAGVIEKITSIGIPGIRVPAITLTLVAFSGGTAVGAFVMWLFGVQPHLPGSTDMGIAPVAEVVALEPSADDYVATVYAARSGAIPVEQQGTAPSPVSAPIVVRPAMTVTSTPAGARVTVNGIGWGATPVTIRHLPPGQKVVRVTKEGYESQQQLVTIAADRRSADVRVTLLASRQRR